MRFIIPGLSLAAGICGLVLLAAAQRLEKSALRLVAAYRTENERLYISLDTWGHGSNCSRLAGRREGESLPCDCSIEEEINAELFASREYGLRSPLRGEDA